MDLSTIIGVLIGLLSVLFPIISGGDPIAFVSISAIFVVLGGGIASAMISYRLQEITNIVKIVSKAFFNKKSSSIDTIVMLVNFSQKARREGLLALESEQEEIEDDFIRQSLQLIVDGVEPEMIRECMDLEIETLESRHDKGHGLFRTLAALFPAWGMIGTLMGLIRLLKNIENAAALGPAMALALVTTFYGAVLAYFVCSPIANKLKIKSKEEVQQKQMIIEGILSIQAGENPRLMEHKLKTFLSPGEKIEYDKKLQENASVEGGVGRAAVE